MRVVRRTAPAQPSAFEQVLSGKERWCIEHGDSEELLQRLPKNVFDSLVTDPPAGIEFMGAEWDTDRGGRAEWVAWLTRIMRGALRVMKPGAHALVWALPRTSHWTAWALEDAGFGIADCIIHINGQGYPKSLDVSKAIDKHLGAEREVLAIDRRMNMPSGIVNVNQGGRKIVERKIGPPATPSAMEWQGFGTALKPATEHWWLAYKPFPGTVVQNVLEHGAGAINIDGCRVGSSGGTSFVRTGPKAGLFGVGGRGDIKPIDMGRWPPNLLLSHTEDCSEAGGCVAGCPVAVIDRQSGFRRAGKPQALKGKGGIWSPSTGVPAGPQYGDAGFGSRYFPTFYYTPKASRSEKERGLEEHEQERGGVGALRDADRGSKRANIHPTVKSIDLMRWLVRLVTPPSGIVLDLFAGSGTTGCAALAEQKSFVGVELKEKHAEIARARIREMQWHAYV